MVKNLLFLTLLSLSARALELSPQQVSDLTLQKSLEAQQIIKSSELQRLSLYQTRSLYDFSLSADTGYETDRSRVISGTEYDDKRIKTNFSLKKNFSTGTAFTLEYNKIAQESEVPSFPDKANWDQIGLTLEQGLFKNPFGFSDRLTLSAAEKNYESQKILKDDQLESLVLTNMRLFWQVYVAGKNLENSTQSKTRYDKLVAAVKHKKSVGFTNAGEFAQVQAEWVTRDQLVKQQSLDYLHLKNQLLLALNLTPNQDIQFNIPKGIPPASAVKALDLNQLRRVKSSQYKIESLDEQLQVSRNSSRPEISLVGKLYQTGLDEEASTATREAMDGSHPKYYLGVKLTHNFGSSVRDEEIYNKNLSKSLEEISLQKEKNDLLENERSLVSKSQVLYNKVQSITEQKKYREQALQEINRSYSQGRVDISNLIDAMNRLSSSEVDLSQAIGDYFITLNELAALRDELVQGSQSGKLYD